jgi:DNA ligase 4
MSYLDDSDNICGYWIKNVPYIYKQGRTIKTSYRYYIPSNDDNVYIDGMTIKYSKLLLMKIDKNTFINLLTNIPSCEQWVLNYFSVYHPDRNINNVRVNGVPIDLKFEGSNTSIIKHIRLLTKSPRISINSTNILKTRDQYISPNKTKKVSPNKTKKVSPNKTKKVSPKIKSDPKAEKIKNLKEMLFSDLTTFFEKLKKSSSKERKPLLKTLFDAYKRSANNDCSILLKLLLPQDDHKYYHMKEATLAKIYIKILSIPETSQDGQRIINWKKPQSGAENLTFGHKYEDFADSLCVTLSHYSSSNTLKLTLIDVNDVLGNLSRAKGIEEQTNILKPLVMNMSPQDNKWLARIILKIGFPEKVVLDSFHPDAVVMYDTSLNLDYVCENLYRLEGRYKGEYIKIFNPLKPMLATRKNLENIADILDKNPIIEQKFDGERLQVHKMGTKIKLFSRKGNNVTSIYGDAIVPTILSNVNCESCILDGEIIVWDQNTQSFMEFGTLKFYAKDKAIKELTKDTTKKIVYIVFDILYFNGEPILNLSLSQRKVLLETIVEPLDHVLEISKSRNISTTDQLSSSIDDAIAKKEEGLMIKLPDSYYYPGIRSKDWIKIKPQYITGIGDELDLIIMGGYYGSSDKRGSITSFILGVLDGNNFLTLSKVGTGYTVDQLAILQKSLGSSWKNFKTDKHPSYMIFGSEVPDVWVDPKNSHVLTVTGHQIIASNGYSSGFTIRFPTVAKIRYDKDYTEITTLKEVVEMDKEFGGHVSGSVESTSHREVLSKIKKRKELKVMAHRQPADVKNIDVISNIFENLSICVINGNDADKKKLEIMIYENGGTFVQNPTEKTDYIIAGKEVLRVKNYRKAGMKILSPEWITQSVEQSKILPINKFLK